MTQPENATTSAAASLEEIQRGWHDLQTRVAQLEAERDALRQETKSLRSLLERAIEHRQKSHAELVLLLTTLVGKLPLNDVGVLVSRLVEHNAGVGEISAALIKGKVDAPLPQPDVLKALDQTKRHLNETIKALVDELLKLDTPLDRSLLETVAADPESFFSPTVLRATRAYVKGQLPRERVVREFGESALVFFNDMTTDPKLNPRPKPEEIVLTFKSDFESLLQQNAQAANGKQKELADLYRKVQESKSSSEQARLQRNAFQKLSFTLELLHYYENQNTEAPDTVFAQRLPVLIEQLVLGGGAETLDEKQIVQAEELLADIINPDHRLMVINNVGKAGGLARTLKYVLLFRNERIPDQHETIQDFVKHLIQPQQAPAPKTLAAILRLAAPAMQKPLVRAIMATDRLRRDEADQLGRAVAKELQLTDFEEEIKQEVSVPPEVERQLAWEKIKDMIARRTDPGTIAAAVRERLHAKYDAEEMRQSWITFTEADPIALIRVFCQLPYLGDGRTDPVARALMESYLTRLMHEKYASTYHRVLNSLKNMYHANPNSPTLLNFLALVRWIDPGAADKMNRDIGMPVPAQP